MNDIRIVEKKKFIKYHFDYSRNSLYCSPPLFGLPGTVMSTPSLCACWSSFPCGDRMSAAAIFEWKHYTETEILLHHSLWHQVNVFLYILIFSKGRIWPRNSSRRNLFSMVSTWTKYWSRSSTAKLESTRLICLVLWHFKGFF